MRKHGVVGTDWVFRELGRPGLLGAREASREAGAPGHLLPAWGAGCLPSCPQRTGTGTGSKWGRRMRLWWPSISMGRMAGRGGSGRRPLGSYRRASGRSGP